MHELVLGAINAIKNDDSGRIEAYLKHARAYHDAPLLGLSADDYAQIDSQLGERPPHLNLVGPISDSIQAKVAKTIPRPGYITIGGDYPMQRAAKLREQFVNGVLYANNFTDEAPWYVRDAIVWGAGVAKVSDAADPFNKTGRVRIDRTYPWDLWVDRVEAYNRQPRTIYQTRLVDKGVLKRMFKGRDRVIDGSSRAKPGTPGFDSSCQQIEVTEAWHLPSGEGADDGCHVICVSEGILQKRKWTSQRFPFAVLNWVRPLTGFWGHGVVERISPLQAELNEMSEKISDSIYHHATTKVVTDDEDLEVEEMDNDARGQVFKTKPGSRLEVFMPGTVSGEVMNERSSLWSFMFNVSGASEMSVTGRKPAGADSGRALLVLNDQESERFIIQGQAIENWVRRITELVEDAAQRLEKDGYEVEVRAKYRRSRQSKFRKIKWSEVNKHGEEFEIQISPVSAFSQTTAGKFALVEMLMQMNMLDQDEAAQLMDLPDTKAVMDRKLAPIELVLDQIEMIIDEGKKVVPSTMQDLSLCIKIGKGSLLRFELDGAEEERLSLLRDYITSAEAFLRQAAEAQAAEQQQAQPTLQAALPQDPNASQGIAA